MCRIFRGLPDEVRKDIEKHLDIKFSNHKTLNIGTMIREAISMEDMQLKRVSMLRTTGGPVNTAIPSVFHMPTTDLTPSASSTPSAVPATPKTTGVLQFSSLVPTPPTTTPNKGVDELSEMIGRLNLSLTETINRLENQIMYPRSYYSPISCPINNSNTHSDSSINSSSTCNSNILHSNNVTL